MQVGKFLKLNKVCCTIIQETKVCSSALPCLAPLGDSECIFVNLESYMTTLFCETEISGLLRDDLKT